MNDIGSILPAVLLTGGAVLLVLLFIRSAIDSRMARRPPAAPPDDAGPLFVAEPEAPRGARGRFDGRFEEMIADTGLGISSAQAVAIIALGAVIGAGVPLLFRDDLILSMVGLLIGVAVPLLFFVFQRMRYRRKVQEQLPDSLFLLARSLRAGQNIEQSLATTARYGVPPLSSEFRRVVEQVNLGMTVPAALRGMARRVRLADFNILVTAVTLHRTVGGNLALLLDRVAAAVRDRNLFRGYFLAATALGRITAFFIAAAPILILIGYATWYPEFIDRFTSTAAGITALTVVAVLEVIGIIWMLFLLRIDY